MAKRVYSVYILTNKLRSTLYIGMTGNLQARVEQHKDGLVQGFTKKYNVNRLVYYEQFAKPATRSLAKNSSRNGVESGKTN